MSANEAFRARGLRPKKSFGQHFLTDDRVSKKIAELATSPEGGTVVEIGAGLGALTTHLLERAALVIAIERDRDLVPILRDTFADAIQQGRLVVREADAAQVDWALEVSVGPRPHVVAGNLPYSITGRLVQQATLLAPSLDGVVFMIQKEVADRLAAPPDGDAYGALSVFAQAAFSVSRALVVKAGAFHPPPEVDSAVVHLVPLHPPRAEETPAFRDAVKRAFAARRKTLRNAWKGLYGWSKEELSEHAARAGIDLDARGETLAVEAFAAIARRSLVLCFGIFQLRHRRGPVDAFVRLLRLRAVGRHESDRRWRRVTVELELRGTPQLLLDQLVVGGRLGSVGELFDLRVHVFELRAHHHRVDLVFRDEAIGQNIGVVVRHFDEAPSHRAGAVAAFAFSFPADDAGLHRRQQRDVTRQHAELALDAGRGQLVDLLLQGSAGGSHDLQQDRVGSHHQPLSVSALALTSSMPPTM